MLFISLSYSQWIKSSGPNTQYIYSLIASDSYVMAGTTDGIYYTSNNGSTWLLKNNGLTPEHKKTNCLFVYGNKIFAGTDSGIYVSSNLGDSWSLKINGLPVGTSRTVHAFTVYNSILFAGTDSGVYVSSNSGESWLLQNSGLLTIHIYSFTIKGNKIFAGSDRNIYVSTNGGALWTAVSEGLPAYTAQALTNVNGNVIAGFCCGSGIYVSTNDGGRWEKIQQDLSANVYVLSGNKIIAGTIQGIYTSSDAGLNWIEHNEGIQYSTTTALAYNSAKLFTGVENYVWHRPLGELISIQNISSEVPKGYNLYQNYPNPFNPSTKIRFDIAANGKGQMAEVKLDIYNSLGQLAEEILNRQLLPGTYEAEWNASNKTSGIYYYKLSIGDFTKTKKMILLK
jgi:photosystem II stability/assembly factor-like uncharacterized protein